MPPIAFLRGWLLILLPVLLFYLNGGTFFNFESQSIGHFPTQDSPWLSDTIIGYLPRRWRPGPSKGNGSIHLQNIACLLLIWRAVISIKCSVNQWTQLICKETNAAGELTGLNKKTKDLRDRFAKLERSLGSSRAENEALRKASLEESRARSSAEEVLRRLKESTEQERKVHQDTIRSSRAENEALRKASLEESRARSSAEEILRSLKETMEQERKVHQDTIRSSRAENEALKKASLEESRARSSAEEILRSLKESTEQERQVHQDTIRSLRSQLEGRTQEMQEMESSLKKELAQKEAVIKKEFENRQRKLKLEVEKQVQMDKASLEESRARISAKEILRTLKESTEQERKVHQDTIRSLRSQLERRTQEMQEMESSLKKELAQKEAVIMKECENRQRKLKLEVAKQVQMDKIQYNNTAAHKSMMAYHQAEMALARQRSKLADVHNKLEEMSNKSAVHSGKSETPQKPQAAPRETDGSSNTGYPSSHNGHQQTDERAAGQDRDGGQQAGGWTTVRGRRGQQK